MARPGLTAAAGFAGNSEPGFQLGFLRGVSRTFALAIPRLPERLGEVVANAYLLCRIADTIEDDAAMSVASKRRFAEQFIAVVAGQGSAAEFAGDIVPALSVHTPLAERALLASTERVVKITHRAQPAQREAITRCVTLMAHGMIDFQECAGPAGLPDLATLNRYCYHVAGVVGELLNRLFVLHSSAVARQDGYLSPRAYALGQALQMTNILKDIWEDHARGACWLPRNIFQREGLHLGQLREGRQSAAFQAGLARMLDIAHGHLQQGLDYCLHLPASEKEIRTFCLWPLAMSLLNLRKIQSNPGFASGAEVKISHNEVRVSGLVCRRFPAWNFLLKRLFHGLSRNFHRAPSSNERTSNAQHR